MKQKLCCLFLACSACLAAEEARIGDPYAICSHVSRQRFSKNAEQQYHILKQIGVKYVRTDFDWKFLEKPSGEWDFSNLDSVVAKAVKHGMTILPILNSVPEKHSPAYQKVSAFADYAGRLSARYRENLPFWEVINEHNISSQVDWNPIHYNKVLNASFRKLKEANPKFQVLYGGTMGIPWDYLEKSLKERPSYDIMNLHPYTIGNFPEESLADNIRAVRSMMEKYGGKNKEIWVTEYGYASADPIGWMNAWLPASLKKVNIDPEKTILTVFDDPEKHFRSIVPNNEREIPKFKGIHGIRLSELKHLDPVRYPVLLVPDGEAFHLEYADDLLQYVKKGGTLIFCGGAPFYYGIRKMPDGSLRRYVCGPETLKKFRLHWHVIPDKEAAVKTIPELGFQMPETVSVANSNRAVSAKNLKPGDTFIPIASSITKSGKKYPLGAIYRFNSDFKGNILYCLGPGPRQSSELQQGRLLPRAYLAMMSAGVRKIFWYRLLDNIEGRTDSESRFGILRGDFSPKDSCIAYKTLVRMCPPDSTVPVIREKNGIYLASWSRPDGTRTFAVWTVDKTLPLKLSVAGCIREIHDHLGRRCAALPASATPGIVYLSGERGLNISL